MAKLDIPDLEAAVSVIQSREAEMTPEGTSASPPWLIVSRL